MKGSSKISLILIMLKKKENQRDFLNLPKGKKLKLIWQIFLMLIRQKVMKMSVEAMLMTMPMNATI